MAEPTVEQQLLVMLMDNEFYEENKQHLVDTMFPEQAKILYDTISEGHKRYERSLKPDDIRELSKILFPTMTRASRMNLDSMLDDLSQIETPDKDISSDILENMWKKEIGRRVTKIGIELTEGKHESLMPLNRIIDAVGEDFMPKVEFDPVPKDIDEIIAATQSRQCWKFNITQLRERIEGGAGGDFAIFFARPEVGKTGFWTTLVSAPDGFASQGAKVHAICNEEPAIRTVQRHIMAASQMSWQKIMENDGNKRLAAKAWGEIKDNIELRDSVGMTIDRLDAYCRIHKPDVLVVDQLDKVAVSGSFARTDEKLKELYVQAREIAKIHNMFVIGICQASAEGEGKMAVGYASMDQSKTGKAGEADLIIGIGKASLDDQNMDSPRRGLYVSKNKITGWHGLLPAMLDPETSTFKGE